MPRPSRRDERPCSACAGTGKRVTVHTLSSMRTATGTSAPMASTSSRAFGVNGSRTNAARLIEPRSQAPYGGSGISPQGLVALIVSQ